MMEKLGFRSVEFRICFPLFSDLGAQAVEKWFVLDVSLTLRAIVGILTEASCNTVYRRRC